MAGSLEIYTDKGGEFRFRLKARNGQTLLASEVYKTKANAENGVASVRKNASEDVRHDRKTTANGKFFFQLTAANGQVIGTSESYDSEVARDNGVGSVKAAAPGASLVDLF